MLMVIPHYELDHITKRGFGAYVNSESPDKLAHPYSLIKGFSLSLINSTVSILFCWWTVSGLSGLAKQVFLVIILRPFFLWFLISL